MSQKTGGAFDDETKQAVWERAKNRCELCGGSGGARHFHHRRPRGMGGTSRVDSGGAANALLLHPACHERVERDRKHAIGLGWLVDQASDPEQVPVRLFDGWWLLTSDGKLIPGPER